MNEVIVTKGIFKSFDENEVLRDINITIEKGEIFGLIGPSGAGKTTLINILTGQLKPTSGEAFMFGKSINELDDDFYMSMGIVFDSLGLFNRLTGYQNLEVFANIFGADKERIPDCLNAVGIDPNLKTKAFEYSKGMRQRLAIARSMLHEPKILFLDEPTSGLDPFNKAEIHKLILAQKERGTTIFLTTHKMDEAAALCDRIALLNNGSIIENDSPANICKKYNADRKIAVTLKNGKEILFNNNSSSAEEIYNLLKSEQIETLHSTEPTLEDVFLQIAKGREKN